eukprot:3631374-Pleurochrysis_carterae.AAC.3
MHEARRACHDASAQQKLPSSHTSITSICKAVETEVTLPGQIGSPRHKHARIWYSSTARSERGRKCSLNTSGERATRSRTRQSKCESLS